MSQEPVRRRAPRVIAGVAGATAAVVLLSGCAGAPGAGTDPAGTPRATAPPAATAVMDGPAYRAARWTYQVSDLRTGEVLLADRPDEFVFTASTAKQFTVGTAYETLGADARLSTPVYATGPVDRGVLQGNLALVASGDLTMGGRNAAQGRADSTFTATTVDHVYGDIAPNAVAPPGNPLAGLDALAAQIAARGIHRVGGDVLVDDRLWQPYEGQEGSVSPVFVNDNLLDLTVTPTTPGRPATVAAAPRTAAYRVVSEVRTEPGDGSELDVSADPRDPHRLTVTGTIGADAGPRLTVYRVPDPASWARTLFVEALARAGVTVTADPLAGNRPDALPPRATTQRPGRWPRSGPRRSRRSEP